MGSAPRRHPVVPVPGGTEVLLYTTILGAIGAFVPFIAREDVDLFQHLELHMRTQAPSLVGRDHLWYRSAYQPIKVRATSARPNVAGLLLLMRIKPGFRAVAGVQNCVDGILCEMYNLLPAGKRRDLAEELERTPAEIAKRLEDFRTKVAL